MGSTSSARKCLGVSATKPKVDGYGEHLDWNQPSILIYEPQADGSLEQVAVENLVFTAAWDAGPREPPTFLGRTWDHMVDNPDTPDLDDAHGFAEHYDQHVWVYRENPPACSSRSTRTPLASTTAGTRPRPSQP